MATFVFIPGMWHGGWCWKEVTPLLRGAGQEVYTPTLTGLGERVHLRCDDIDLNTHIQDIVNLFKYEDLHQAILVGHSYGGCMAPAVAEEIPERIMHIVNLDGPILENGNTMKDLIGDYWNIFKQNAIESGNEWWTPHIVELTFGVSGADLDWMMSKLTPHPLKTLITPVVLSNPAACSISRTFISCVEGLSDDEIAAEEKKFKDMKWDYRSIATGHDAMITMPEKLTEILLELAEAYQ